MVIIFGLVSAFPMYLWSVNVLSSVIIEIFLVPVIAVLGFTVIFD